MMKHNLKRRLLSVLCTFVLLLGLVPTAFAAGSPAESNNYVKNLYSGNTADTIKSYLYQNSSGGLTRVEHIRDVWNETETIVVEDYSSSFQLLSSRTIPMELSRWGGFYAGSQYNYLIFGQNNSSYSDSVEVVRVVKYSKDWQRLGQASVYGANTKGPFGSGAVRCAESGGYLYIHTCHTMYPASDGKNHQANMTIVVRENDMTVTETNCKAGGFTGYVSHSFNQFIIVDSLGNILTADHGDAYPRAMVLYKFNGTAGKASFPSIFAGDDYSTCGYVSTEPFMGNRGDNRTNAQLGSIAETSSGYMMAYAMGDNQILIGAQQARLAYISKNNFGHYFVDSSGLVTCNNTFQERVLTSYTGYDPGASAPYLVPTGLDGGWMMWNEIGRSEGLGYIIKGFSYARYNADGSVGAVKTVNDVALSDCQPILYNGQVVWYTTHNSAPVFYTLDASGVQSHPAGGSGTPSTPSTPSTSGAFSDVSASHWAYNDIMTCANQGIVSGVGNGKFDPEGTVTGVQFIAMMTRTFHSDKVAAVTVPAGSPWYYANIKAAEDIRLNSRVTIDENPMSRHGMAKVLSNEISYFDAMRIAAGKQGIKANIPDEDILAAKTAFKDWDSMNLEQQSAAAYCYALGLLSGMPDSTFSGESTMTRAQACAVIVRMMNLVNS